MRLRTSILWLVGGFLTNTTSRTNSNKVVLGASPANRFTGDVELVLLHRFAKMKYTLDFKECLKDSPKFRYKSQKMYVCDSFSQ